VSELMNENTEAQGEQGDGDVTEIEEQAHINGSDSRGG
jgi:hypothetical protein